MSPLVSTLCLAVCLTPPPVKPTPSPAAPATRPVVPFDLLPAFDDDKLKDLAQRLHNLAESVKQKDWVAEYYQDARYSGRLCYVGKWSTGKLREGSIHKKELPYRDFSLAFKGKPVAGVERLTSLSVSGTSAPKLGWGAKIHCYLEPDASGKRTLLIFGWAAQMGPLDHALSFDVGPHRNSLFLGGQRHLEARASDGNRNQFRFYAQLPPPDAKRVLKAFYGTPEELRDFILADIDALRKQSEGQFEAVEGFTFYDMSNVRSDNPPRPEPLREIQPGGPGNLLIDLPDSVKSHLAKHVQDQLKNHEDLVQKNFREIHAAVQEALPLQEFVQELTE